MKVRGERKRENEREKKKKRKKERKKENRKSELLMQVKKEPKLTKVAFLKNDHHFFLKRALLILILSPSKGH